MSNQAERVLSQAFELIEADRLNEARAILKPILENDKDNPDAWWLYAHAVSDAETARLALNNVLRLDPDYADAENLLRELESQLPSRQISFDDAPDGEPSFLPPLPPTLPGLPGSKKDLDDEWEFPEEKTIIAGERPSFRRPVFLAVALVALIAFAIVLLILLPRGQQENTTPPTASLQAEVVLDTTQIPTSVLDTPLPIESQVAIVETEAVEIALYAPVYAALSTFTISENGITVEQTSLGNTLLVEVCTAAGLEMRSALPEVVEIVAEQSTIFAEDVDALGARMKDCANDTILLVVAAPIAEAIAYANGDINQADFQATWQSIG